MKRAAILTVTLLFAGLPAPSSNGLYITEIKQNGNFQLSDRTYWRALIPRTVQHRRTGDEVTGAHSNSCGYDPNVYLVTDRLQQAHVNIQVMTRLFLTTLKNDPALAVNGHAVTVPVPMPALVTESVY